MATAYERVNDPAELLEARTEQEVTDRVFAHFAPASVHAVDESLGTPGEGARLVAPAGPATGVAGQWGEHPCAAGCGAVPWSPAFPDAVRRDSWPPHPAHAVGLPCERNPWGRGVGRLVVRCRHGGAGPDAPASLWFPLGRTIRHVVAAVAQPLWAVAAKTALTGRNCWGALVAAILPVMILWRSWAPDQLGGVGDWALALAVLPMPTLFVGLLAGTSWMPLPSAPPAGLAGRLRCTRPVVACCRSSGHGPEGGS